MLHSSSSKPKHRHETSMDNFIKNIKKHNQRSERYMSPPLLYMYSRNHTTNTIDKSRSRTLSNRKSSVGGVSKTKKKIDKILKSKSKENLTNRNPAYIIEECGSKLKKVEKYLEKKNQIAHYLCQNFLKMLNQIVEKMIVNLDAQLKDIENKATRKVEGKYQKQLYKLQKQNSKLAQRLKQNLQKLDNNSSLIYHLRMLSNIDIDYLYGKCILGTEECGGIGYGKANQSQISQKFELDSEEYRARYVNNQDDENRRNEGNSSGVSDYRKQLLQFEQLSQQHQEIKDKNLFQETVIHKKNVHQMEEGMGEMESGRIIPVQDWKKLQKMQKKKPGNQFLEEGEDCRNPFGRRLT